MNSIIYPVIGKQTALPFYLSGIGTTEYEYHIRRENGLISHQILFTKSGSGILNIDGKTYRLSQGSLLYLAPSVPHEYYPETDKWTTCWVVFRGEHLAQLMEKLGFSDYMIYENAVTDNLERLFELTRAAASDSVSGAEASSVLLYEYILEIRKIIGGEYGAAHSGIVASALQYIENSYMTDITLEMLCSGAGITPQHFCRLFRKQVGMRPLEYIARRRISQAKYLLISTDKPVAEVGKLVGYPDPTYFGVVFRKYESISPSEYRKCKG